MHIFFIITNTGGGLRAQTGQSSNAAQRGSQIGHLMDFRKAHVNSPAVASEENRSGDTVQIEIPGRIS